MKQFNNYRFSLPTEIVFGVDAEKNLPSLIEKYGGTKVMLVYEGEITRKTGIYDRIVSVLRDGNIPFAEIDGVQPNPRRSLAVEGVRVAMEAGADFVLAVGGASTIDTGKAIALGIANDGDFWQFFSWNPHQTAPTKKVPVGAVNTLAAAGSETSFSIVIRDDLDLGIKCNCNFDINRPSFAIMNPEFTYTVPKYQTALGTADILAHTFDRYFNDSYTCLGDSFAVGVMRNAVKYGPIAVRDPSNYEARAELMITASMSHNGITGIGRAGMGGGGHSLEIQLSGTYDTPHGAGLGVLMPAYLDYLIAHGEAHHVARAAQFAIDIFDVPPELGQEREMAEEGVRRFRAWIRSMDLPLTLTELGIPNPEKELEAMVARCRCAPDGIIHGFIDLDKAAVRAIYSSVLK